VLLTDFDPAAAAVAAATWLRAAAGLAAEQARLADKVTVIQFADDIEAVPVQTLTTVLGMLDENDPYTQDSGHGVIVDAGSAPGFDLVA